jgi:hypothetical protein
MMMKTYFFIIFIIFSFSTVYGQRGNSATNKKTSNEKLQHSFLVLDSLREDSTYLQHVSDELQALLETGEYDYICVDQSAAEWIFIDQYVKGHPRLEHLLYYYVSFYSTSDTGSLEFFPANDAVMKSLLYTLRKYNQGALKPVSALGLDFAPKMDDKLHSSWLTYPVTRRIVAFNEATVSDSLMALTDKWWNFQDVAANTFQMMNAHKRELTQSMGETYYVLWRHFFKRYAELRCSPANPSPISRSKHLQDDFRFIDEELPGGKIIIGYDWLFNCLSND